MQESQAREIAAVLVTTERDAENEDFLKSIGLDTRLAVSDLLARSYTDLGPDNAYKLDEKARSNTTNPQIVSDILSQTLRGQYINVPEESSNDVLVHQLKRRILDVLEQIENCLRLPPMDKILNTKDTSKIIHGTGLPSLDLLTKEAAAYDISPKANEYIYSLDRNLVDMLGSRFYEGIYVNDALLVPNNKIPQDLLYLLLERNDRLDVRNSGDITEFDPITSGRPVDMRRVRMSPQLDQAAFISAAAHARMHTEEVYESPRITFFKTFCSGKYIFRNSDEDAKDATLLKKAIEENIHAMDLRTILALFGHPRFKNGMHKNMSLTALNHVLPNGNIVTISCNASRITLGIKSQEAAMSLYIVPIL